MKIIVVRKGLSGKSLETILMELRDKSFVQNFRLFKRAFMYVLQSINDHLPADKRSTAVPAIIKLGATLKFLGQGGYQHQIGEDRHAGLAQQTLFSCIAQDCNAMEKIHCPKHINFRMTDEEIKEAKHNFFGKSGIPGVISVIDGTHIQMIRPSKSEHLFFNRKLKHSINAMVICDHKLYIRAVNGRYGVSSHDSHVWSLSHERHSLKQKFEAGKNSSWIIGESGYPIEPWILTSYRNAPENSSECYFNQQFSKARSTIERVFGILKDRFRCLLAARELHYAPEKVAKILNVCCALHNICLIHKMAPLAVIIEAPTVNAAYQIDIFEDTNFVSIAQKIRDQIKNNLRQMHS